MDCAGRAERRRRFRAHDDPGKLPRRSCAPKRCRASLATALQNTPGEPARPLDCGDMSPLWLRRQTCSGVCFCPAFGVFPACSQSGVVPPHSKHARGESTRPMDCAGRAERRRRFRAHDDLGNLPRRSRVPKRCRASLATALQNTPGEPARPMDCGDMSPLLLHRQNCPGVCFLFDVRCIPGLQPKRRRATALQTRPANPRPMDSPAERSGDGAFARTTIPGNSHAGRALQSGVALRLPPHSKTRRANPHALWTAVTCHRFCCAAKTILRVCFCPAFGAFSA
jgi:hypothetical protein